MPLRIRRVIFYAFILLFLIVAPMLALYSMGYRYHWGKQRLETTGLLTVAGTPTDAVVLLDGVVRARGLPARLGGLSGNEYIVRMERPGYRPWEQRVTIRGGQTAVIADVLLFRESDPVLTMSATITAFAVSADRRWAAFTRTVDPFTELWTIDLRTMDPRLALRVPNERATGDSREPSREPVTFRWSPRNSTLLVRTETDARIVTPGPTIVSRTVMDGLPALPDTITWELGSATSLIATANERLYRIATATGRTTLLAPPAPSVPFAVARGTLYTANGNRVTSIPTDGGTRRTIATLPDTAVLTEFLTIDGTTITAAGALGTTITITTTDGTVAVNYGGVPHGQFRGDAWFRMRGASEIWMESATGDPYLLTRRSAAITDTVWHPEDRHILLATTTEIIAVEVADRPFRTETTLATFDAIRAIAPSISGDDLLIVGRRGTAEGLWSLALR